MTNAEGDPAMAGAACTSGPTVSFEFNLAKVAGQGEDSDPILRDGPDLGLIGVFDGMGGAGGTVYETPDGPRTGAYLASRIARDVVEHRMLDLLEPDWNLNGPAAAEDLRRSVQDALQQRFADLKAPTSRLRSKLLRALPTTMAVIALQRAQRSESTWACHVFWTGDSRAYAFSPDGAHQLSTDDLRDANDAMTNLHRDSVVSNAMSADTSFHVNYRRVELLAPFLLAGATDGCFGYLPSPMHFEHLVLESLTRAGDTEAWSSDLQTKIAGVTGDDAAMAMMGVGADLRDFQLLFAARVAALEEQFIGPLDELNRSLDEAERALETARERQRQGLDDRWQEYRLTYEEYLRPPSPAADAEPASPGGPEEDASSSSGDPDPEGTTGWAPQVDPSAARDATPDPPGSGADQVEEVGS